MTATLAMVAGEPSGDLLAAHLLTHLRPHLPDTCFEGIGGPKMAELGFISHWPMDKLSVFGLFEVLKHYRDIKGIQSALCARLLRDKPSAFIGVDAPDFNFHVETQLHDAGIPTLHFVSPSIWAWRRGRINKIKRSGSHMLVILPFEEAIYQQAGIPVTYVGHPLAQMIPMVPDVTAARVTLGLSSAHPVIALLPGSRLAEIRFHTAAFMGAAKLLLQRNPHCQFIVPMVGVKQAHIFKECLTQAGLEDIPFQTWFGPSHTAMAAADVVLVASGTASLEVALHKKPMVIAYKVMWPSYLIGRLVTYLPWIGLPNILAKETLVPEFIQHAMTPTNLANALWKQLHDEPEKERLRHRFTEMHHTLLRDTGRESAQAVLRVLGR